MSNVTFEVANINERKVNTKYGLKSAFDIVATDGTKYGFGFTNPNRVGVAIGTKVTGLVSTGSYGLNLDPKTITVGGAAPLTPPAAAPSKPMAGTGRGERVFPIPTQSGEMAIIRQNALTNAVATVADYVATQPSEKWPDLDTWTDMVIDVAYKFAKFSSGQREVDAAMKLSGIVSVGDLNAAMKASMNPDAEDEAA